MTSPTGQQGRSPLVAAAIAVLRANDRGAYTVPTEGLYPFQWNWDSCFTALGQSHYDLDRAWTEIETLFAHQWDDGMVPHMVFHQPAPGYFPGPEVWGTGRRVPTSGITQLPVAGFAVNQLHKRGSRDPATDERARRLLHRLDRWHAWFYSARDPRGEGLAAIIHPWESRDNSVDWDEALSRVPSEGVAPYDRNDLKHADPATRPTRAEYDRYLWLVQHFRGLGWDNSVLHDTSPFRVVDPGFNALLIRSCLETADMAARLGEPAIAAANRSRGEKGLAALDRLWSDRAGQYLPFDRVGGGVVESASIGGLMAVFAPVPRHRAQAMARRIGNLGRAVSRLVPSHDPADPRFDIRRYWRGPVWLVCNYLIADGLRKSGEHRIAATIIADSLALIGESGFAEYYDPADCAPLGGSSFSWTAAMALELLEPW